MLRTSDVLLRIMAVAVVGSVHADNVVGQTEADLPTVYEQISGMLDHDQVAEAVLRIDDLAQRSNNDPGLAQLVVIMQARLRRMNGDVRGAYHLVDSLKVNEERPDGQFLSFLVLAEKVDRHVHPCALHRPHYAGSEFPAQLTSLR